MERCFAFFLFCLSVLTVYGQKTKSVTGSYIYYAPDDISLEEAKHIAVNRAKINAISDAFGTLVTQNNATIISNSNGKSENRFLSLGGSEVKGDWIETTSEPVYDIKYEQGTLVIKVTIKGIVREFPKNNLTFSSKILRNGTTEKYESDDFKNGDDMYLLFSSPTDGYLVAYLFDETSDMAICLLPYIAENSEGVEKIKGGKQCLFFKKSSLDDNADEYTLTASSDKTEFETLYLIFSTQPIYTIDKDVNNDNEGLRSVPYKTFISWLADMKKKQDVKVTERTITIKP